MKEEAIKKKLSKKIVEAILEDMCNRSGLENEWDAIDEGTQKEIIETWNEIVFNLVDTLDN